ncbi:MAG: hypothetical protein CUN55_07605 [Phototrophicales bacterium]|nr:MAG: hypothetical protein CUN55_07605 [Phototrophicales bacterium]
MDTETFGAQTFEQLLQQLNDTNYWEGELPFKHQSGQHMWHFVRVSRIDFGENVIGNLIVGTNLVDHEIRHHRVQSALDYSQRELSSILSAVGDMVCSYNVSDYNFDFISPSCLELTGYTEFEFMDHPNLFFEMILAEYRPTVEEAFKNANPNETIRLEYQILRKDGEERWVSNSLTPFEDETQKHIICALTDTTAYHNLNELKSRMIRMASHDLNNPLSTAIGFFSLLASDLEGMLNEEQKMMVENIHRSHERMANMLEELLDVEQIQARINLDLKPIDLVQLIEKILQDFTFQIQQKEHAIEFVTSHSSIIVQVDPVQIEHALSNYLSNAIKYTPPQGEILISVFADDRHVIVEFTDNGIGIPESARDKLFQPFFRVKQQGTENISGTGLGLSLIKSVIKQHRGDVYYRPESQGSTFGLWLPL